MLHPYREASRISIPLVSPPGEQTPGWELISMLMGINRWLEAAPSVFGSLQGTALYILYRDAAFLVDAFWEAFAPAMAAIQTRWPVCVLGTAPNQETVRLSVETGGTELQLVQQSLSGECAEALDTLCIHLDCADSEIARHLITVLAEMNWQTNVAAVGWQEGEFLREQRLLWDPEARGFFCYAGLDEESTSGDCLRSLDFRQKISLWTAFLIDGFEPLEFDWLQEEMAEGTLAGRMEWELALWETLEQLHFRVVNQEKAFALYDGSGRRLYLGADGRRPAEWVLMKLLFPLNYQ